MTAHATLAFATLMIYRTPSPPTQLGARFANTPGVSHMGKKVTAQEGSRVGVMRYCYEGAQKGATDIATPVVQRAWS